MCRSKMAIRTTESMRNNNKPNPPSRRSTTSSSSRKTSSKPQPEQQPPTSSSSSSLSFSAASSSSYRLDTSVGPTSLSSRTSLSSLRQNLPEYTQIYDFSEIRAATNNFLAKRHSSSSSSQSWRCSLKGKDVIIFQRKLRKNLSLTQVQDKLSVVSKSHFTSIVKLLGISISGEHIYLVYDFVQGSDLSVCLRSKLNPDFTVLSTWMSRIQIATDVAHGLDYIHNTAGLSIDMVHKHVKSSGIIVTEPSFNAKICHFGAAELCGGDGDGKLEGVTGYMSPEFKATGVATQRSDVYAFGVVILELLTGEEPVKYKFDKRSGDYKKISLVDTAVDDAGELRRWVDKRLKDSFPVEVADKLTRVALQCVQDDPDKRPDMKWVAGKISKLYLESRIWSDRIKHPSEISVSLAPR